MTESKQLELGEQKRRGLLQAALSSNALSIAEDVFRTLQKSSGDQLALAVCASQISAHCRQDNKPDKALKYKDIATVLAQSNAFVEANTNSVSI